MNVPAYSVSELLKRLDNLVELSRSGFNIFIPEITLGTQQGQLFTGYVTSYESGSITLVQEKNHPLNPSIMVLNADNIVSIAFDYDERVNALLDPAQLLPYSVDMGPLDFKRLMQKYSEEISKKVNVEIQIENMFEVKVEIIPHLCNALNIIKQSIIRITLDDLGAQLFKDHVEKIQICEAGVASFELQGKTHNLKFPPSVRIYRSVSLMPASKYHDFFNL